MSDALPSPSEQMQPASTEPGRYMLMGLEAHPSQVLDEEIARSGLLDGYSKKLPDTWEAQFPGEKQIYQSAQRAGETALKASLATERANKAEAENNELKYENAGLRYEKDHDPLSGLMNRAAWEKEVAAQIATGRPFSIVYMDLDGFKQINDTKGHSAGDQIIRQFGGFMNTKFRREYDAVARITGRLGGDEFGTIVYLDDQHDFEGNRREEDPKQRLQKGIDFLAASLDEFVDRQSDDIKNNKDIGFHVSYGCANYDPTNPIEAHELIKVADEAMYKAKNVRKALLKEQSDATQA